MTCASILYACRVVVTQPIYFISKASNATPASNDNGLRTQEQLDIIAPSELELALPLSSVSFCFLFGASLALSALLGLARCRHGHGSRSNTILHQQHPHKREQAVNITTHTALATTYPILSL